MGGQLITGPITFITGPGGTVGVIAQTGGSAAQGQQSQGSSKSTLAVIGQSAPSVGPTTVTGVPAATPTNIIVPQINLTTVQTAAVPLNIRENGVYVSGDAETLYSSGNWQNFTPSASGVFRLKWGAFGTGDGEFDYPRGVAVAPDGSVYVTDTNGNQIKKFSSTGAFQLKWGSSGTGDGQFSFPQSVAIASDGSVYVSEFGNNRAQKFSATGVFQLKWGTFGTGDGQLDWPQGIIVGSDDSVYISDSDNNRIQKFSSTGVFQLKWGTFGTGDGQFDSPRGIAAAFDGSVYVVDTVNNRIQNFT